MNYRTVAAILVVVLGATLISCADSGSSSPGEWPTYRGANRDGISHEKGWKVWTDSPKIAWKQNIGAGYSTVAVAGGRVYTMGGGGNVLCLNADTGEIVWTAGGGDSGRGSRRASHTQGTPTVDDGLVYALGPDGKLVCLKADSGDPVWSKSLPSEFRVRWGGWGPACTPLVLGDKLILDVGRMLVLDKKTGALIRQAGADKSGYSSSVAFSFGGETCLTAFGASGLAIYRLSDGKELGSHPWKTAHDVNATTPIISGDKIFIATGYGRGCTLLKLTADGLTKVYENRSMANHAQSCVLYEGHIYGVHGQQGSRGSLKCLDFDSGQTKWEQTGLSVGGGLMIADGKIIALVDGGELLIAEAVPTGYKQLARARVARGKCWTVPVLAGGRIYCRSYAGELVCVDVR